MEEFKTVDAPVTGSELCWFAAGLAAGIVVGAVVFC
jgi:hypothetical protein